MICDLVTLEPRLDCGDVKISHIDNFIYDLEGIADTVAVDSTEMTRRGRFSATTISMAKGSTIVGVGLLMKKLPRRRVAFV